MAYVGPVSLMALLCVGESLHQEGGRDPGVRSNAKVYKMQQRHSMERAKVMQLVREDAEASADRIDAEKRARTPALSTCEMCECGQKQQRQLPKGTWRRLTDREEPHEVQKKPPWNTISSPLKTSGATVVGDGSLGCTPGRVCGRRQCFGLVPGTIFDLRNHWDLATASEIDEC